MRLVDEITERPATQALPAPSGPRAPTGPVPLILPAPPTPPPIPPPVSAVPLIPHLPPVQPKIAAPVNGPVPATPFAAATLNLTTTSLTTKAQPKPKRARKRLIALGVIVLVPLVPGIVLRNTAFVERFTGKGYDTNPLPVQAFDKPAFTGSEYTISTQEIAIFDGLPTNFWETHHDVVNYTEKAAKETFDRAKASVIGGTIGTPRAASPPIDAFVDQQSFYRAGESATDPWTRVPLTGWRAQSILSPNSILMYQDVIDPTLRTRVPTSVKDETRHETPVTTYTYTFAFGDFYESAPRLFELVNVMDGNAADDALVKVTVSLDEQWVVRYLDVNVDYDSVLEHRAKQDVGALYPYQYSMDVIKLTEKPEPVHIPSNVVDETTTTTTADTLPVATP
jgi:hypothetical protein